MLPFSILISGQVMHMHTWHIVVQLRDLAIHFVQYCRQEDTLQGRNQASSAVSRSTHRECRLFHVVIDRVRARYRSAVVRHAQMTECKYCRLDR